MRRPRPLDPRVLEMRSPYVKAPPEDPVEALRFLVWQINGGAFFVNDLNETTARTRDSGRPARGAMSGEEAAGHLGHDPSAGG